MQICQEVKRHETITTNKNTTLPLVILKRGRILFFSTLHFTSNLNDFLY